ncbi:MULTISPECIES: hypothetical protein [unclassified Clostridium]|uniref:hypothetical protein n=1 Tax=unclassified Clostridium TaxID=2614128 RepID=UPI000EBDA9CF|nr:MULTISPECIES: hypothetical protein [unclassified Clostridium]HCQ89846.1 hypothetical protein [Clostridium sp.]
MKRSSKVVLSLIALTLIVEVGLNFINKEDLKESMRKNIIHQMGYRITRVTPIEVTIQVDESYMPKDK